MQVHYNIEELPSFSKAVITIGTFDGVHSGHQKVIAALLSEAKKAGGESVIITFHPHPRKIVAPDSSLQLINTLEEKIALLSQKGIDHLVIVDFTPAFAAQNAEQYLQDFLIAKFHPHTIIIGYDHHFGKDRKGNYTLLEKEKGKWGYQLVEIPKHVLNEIDISSTKIRHALQRSDIAAANHLLGYSFFFEGKVVMGDQLGRTLGYPTANLIYIDADKIHLGEGVYAVRVAVRGEMKKGMLSIGKRPTLNDTEERVEVNIFDFDKTIYGEDVQVFVEHFLRHQEKYSTLEELKAQLKLDKEKSLELLNG